MPPTLIAQLSDPHIRLDDDASQPALAAAVERVLALQPLPIAVLVTGDIANSGDPAEHERARELLAPLPIPVFTAAGNHDLLGMRHQYAAQVGEIRLVVCDTSIAGHDEGALDVEWLADQLVPDVPTIVAMHHPPILMGLPWLDAIGLPQADRDGLAAVVRDHPQVKRVVAGHVHRATSDVLGGCAVVTCASTNIASALDFTTEAMALANEPPSLLVHAFLGHGAVTTHVQPI